MKKLIIALALIFTASNYAKAERVDLSIIGADASGKTLNTDLINATIERLSSDGGGTLFFPAGDYLTGPIELRSNITIDLESGATIRFSDDFDLYLPFVKVRHEGVMMRSFKPMLYANECENITIKGEGTLDGQGQKWWTEFSRVVKDVRANGKNDINKYQVIFEEENDMDMIRASVNEDWHESLNRRFFRSPLVHFLDCAKIRISGVTFTNSPFWTINPQYCDNLTIHGITIDNPGSDAPNTDGINPESCSNVRISDCHISVGDDCITIKSGRDKQGRDIGVPCDNITITNCTMLAGHGGVVIGSEMSGGVKRIVISNCVFDGTDRGIRIKSTRGRGGVVEDIRVSNIVMHNIQREAIMLNLKYSKMPDEPKSERTPEFKNVYISGLSVNKVDTPIRVIGLKEAPITGITVRDFVTYNAKNKPLFENCEGLIIEDVYVDGEELKL